MTQPQKGMSLPEWQGYIKDMVERRGFNTNLQREFILFTEEVGELAKEVRSVWEIQDKLIKEGMSEEKAHQKALEEIHPKAKGELADCFMYLINLATMMGVDAESAIIEKEKINETRSWD